MRFKITCIVCGSGNTYHRKTFFREMRCRSCGAQFSLGKARRVYNKRNREMEKEIEQERKREQAIVENSTKTYTVVTETVDGEPDDTDYTNIGDEILKVPEGSSHEEWLSLISEGKDRSEYIATVIDYTDGTVREYVGEDTEGTLINEEPIEGPKPTCPKCNTDSFMKPDIDATGNGGKKRIFGLIRPKTQWECLKCGNRC